jgi:NAD(P)-dependent dehydrogenase (short-subunit alcohol dehydrogenase family)
MTVNQPIENRTDPLTGTTAIVTGVSRGFGRAIATALAEAGAHVVGVARGSAQLEELHDALGDSFSPVTADAADPDVANRLIDQHRPRTLVLCAGASPTMSPLQDQTWESFSQTWDVDVAQAFHWSRHALRRPLAPGSRLPRLTPATQLGAKAVAAYAGRQGVDVETFVKADGPSLTAEQVGRSVVELAAGRHRDHGSYLLTAAGLSALAANN